MRLSKSWIIASKDFKVYSKKKNLIYVLFVVPLLIAFLIPGVIGYVAHRASGIGRN